MQPPAGTLQLSDSHKGGISFDDILELNIVYLFLNWSVVLECL